MVQTKKFISFILVLAMVLSTMFAVSVPVFAESLHEPGVYTGANTWTSSDHHIATGATITVSAGSLTVTDDAKVESGVTIQGAGNNPNTLAWSDDDYAITVGGVWASVTVSNGGVYVGNANIQTMTVRGGLTYGAGTVYLSNSSIGALTVRGDDASGHGTVYSGNSNIGTLTVSGGATVTATSGVYQTITVEASSADLQNVSAGSLTVNSATATVTASGVYGTITVNDGLVDLQDVTADNLLVNGGTVYGYGAIGNVTVNDGAVYIGYTSTNTDDVSATGSSITKGLIANGGVTNIANTTISDSTLSFAVNDGIVYIAEGATVNLNEGAAVDQTEKYRTSGGTMLAVYNAGTFTMTGSSIFIKTDGDTLAEENLALRGIYNYASGSKTYITSGSIQLINGTSSNKAIYNQGTLTLGVHDDAYQVVAIDVDAGGLGIETTGNGSSTTIYDAALNVSGDNGTGILARTSTNLLIISGPETVGKDVPSPASVFVDADGAGSKALVIGNTNVKWSIVGGYKTAVFTAEHGFALDNASTNTPDTVGHDVYQSGKPLTAGYFIGEIGGTSSDLNSLIPDTNYVIYNESGNYNVVIDLRWEVQNAFESDDPEVTSDTALSGSVYTYTLPKDITFGEGSSLHGRTATTTVALDAKDNREIVWNDHTIDHCTSAGATSTTTGSALYYYTQDSDAAPNGSANLYYNLGTGAYLEYSSAPGLTANYSDLSSLIDVANGNNPSYLNNIVVFKGDHSLNVTPNALNTSADPILVKPHDAQATTLTITGAAAYTYYVKGEDEGADASSYAALVVNAENAIVYVTGEFASVDVQAGTVYLVSGCQVVSLTQTGGTLYTENGVTSNGSQQVTLNAAVAANATATAIGTYYSVINNGDGDLTIGDETNTSGTFIANGLFNNAGTATAIYATISALNQDAEGSRAVTVSGGEIILATGAAVYKNNEYDSINGRITGVYVAKYAMLTMLTGSSIYLEATPEQTVALYGVDNHGTADLQSGSIELVKGAGNYGVDSYEFVKLGVYNDTTASINITVDKAGTGLYVHADSEAYVYGTDILTKLGGTGIKAGSGSTDTSSLIIMAGTSTVSAILPTPTVSVTAEDDGTALSIEAKVKWAVAGGYKTAVFTGTTALDAKGTQTPSVTDVHSIDEYVLQENKPLTAGYFDGAVSSLGDLIPTDANYAVSKEADKLNAVVDLTWELKNVMEVTPVDATVPNYVAATGTYTLPADVDYSKIDQDLHGHYYGDPVVHTSNAGITIDLNDHTWTASSGAIALNATQNVYLTNGGIHAAGNDAVVHNGGLLFMYDMGVASSSGSAIKNIDGTVLGLFDSALYGSVDALDITTGPAFMLDSYVIASDNAIKHKGGAPLVIFSSTVGAVTGHAVEHIETGSLTIASGGAFTSNGGNVIELKGSGEIDILDAEITAKDSYIAINDQLASPGSLNIEDATITAASGHAIYYQGVTDLDITNSTVSAIDQNAVCNNATGTLTVSGGTITSTNGEAVCIDNTSASFIDGATVSSQNNNAIHQKKGDLTITSGAFGSTSGHAVWVEAGANMLTIVDGTFTAADGFYGLLVDDPAKLTPLTAGTFSSVRNATSAGILYQVVSKSGIVPAYTFRDSEGDLLSAWDLHAKQEITNGAIATFYATGTALVGPFTVVARPAYEIYYTSSDAITHTADSATELKGNDGDWYAMAFATGTAVTVTATAIDGYLVKEAAHMTYAAFTKQGCSFAAIDLQGDAANQASYAVNLDGSEDYVMSVTGAAAKTVTLSAVENYDHGSFGYKFVNAENANSDYTLAQPARVTASAASGVAIKVADGNAISLGFKPDTDHAVHQNKTDFDGLTFTTTGGAFDTKDSLVTGTAVIDADHTLAVAFCDMTVPVPVSTAGVTTDRSTYTGAGNAIELTGPTTNSAVDAHNLIDLTAGTWKYTKWNGNTTTSASVYITPNGNKATVYSTEAGVATFEFTPAVSPAAAVTPDPVTFTVTFTEPPTSGGGGGGGGGGAAASNYDVSVTTDGSDIKTDKTKAAAGDTVTITVPEGTTGVTITDEKGNVIPVTKVNDTTYTFKMPSSKVKVATEKATGLIRFVDVPMDKYYYDAVNWAVANGITTGTDATHFSPDALTDRAQFVTFLWRAAGSPEPTGDASTFKDVSSDKYYAKAVAWAVENGITNGLEADQFGPTVPVSRAHVVTFLYRFAKAAGTYSSDFVDLKKGDFYEDAAGWAVENGITTGIDATHFNPDGPAVRAQTITFLYRYFTK